LLVRLPVWLLGWLLGSAASRFVASIDHWVAFVLLAGLGIHMVWKSFQPLEPECGDQADAPYDAAVQLGADGSALRAGRLLPAGLLSMLLTSVATSIDAMAVGVTFAFGEINILYACCVIGLVCFVLCVAACYVGKLTGEYLHSKALVLGGAILILIGVKILLSHLGVIDI